MGVSAAAFFHLGPDSSIPIRWHIDLSIPTTQISPIFWNQSKDGGAGDAVLTIEAPNDEAYATLILNIAAQGNIRTTTLKAFSEEESFRIFGNLS